MKMLVGRLVLVIGVCVSVLAAADEQKSGKLPPGHEKLVCIEVALLELTPRTEGLGELDEVATKQLIAKLQKLEQAGEIGTITRMRLTTIEDQTATAQYGEQAAVVTGRSQFGSGRAGGGGVSISHQNFGTLLSVTPSVNDDGDITIKLVLEKSGQAKAAPTDEQKEATEVGLPPAVLMINIQTMLRMRDGQTVVAQAMDSSSGKDSSQTIVLVTARVIGEQGDAPKKAGARKISKEKVRNGKEDVEVRIWKLRNAQAADAARYLGGLLDDPSLEITIDERTNSLLVRGPVATLKKIDAVVAKLDAE